MGFGQGGRGGVHSSTFYCGAGSGGWRVDMGMRIPTGTMIEWSTGVAGKVPECGAGELSHECLVRATTGITWVCTRVFDVCRVGMG